MDDQSETQHGSENNPARRDHKPQKDQSREQPYVVTSGGSGNPPGDGGSGGERVRRTLPHPNEQPEHFEHRAAHTAFIETRNKLIYGG